MTAGWLLSHILAAVALFGIFSGIPLWLVLRHPDRSPHDTETRPAYMH